MRTPVTIADALIAAAATPRGVTAVEHDGRSTFIAYADLLQEALRAAGALRGHGLVAGDRAALVVPEVGGFVKAFFGLSVAGLVPVPLVPPAQAGDLATFARQSRHLLLASRAAAVVTTPDVAPLLDLTALQPQPRICAVDDLLRGPALAAPAAPAADATALLQFTSGATAAPKGVVLSHRNLAANVTAISGPAGLDVSTDDIGVSWLPLYHDMGLIGMLLAAMYATVSVVILSPVLFLKRPTAWLEAISRYRGTISFAPDFAYELCVRRVKPAQIGALDLASWRIAGCGAEPIRPDSLARFAEHFARAGFRRESFVASYGLAEHALAVSFSRRGFVVDSVDADALVRESRAVPVVNGSPAIRLVGCGGPFPGHAIRIVDDTGTPLAEREVGRIVARGPSVMEGYFEDAAATAEALQDGWLQTGDVGYLAGGELYVCGRTRDLIIRQGRKYHPPDLEAAIADVPGVRPSGVVVFGITRFEGDDEAVAVLEARAALVPSDLVEQVRRRVRETAGLELDRVVLTPPGSIPRTTSGKVRRAETRSRLAAGTLVTGGRTEADRLRGHS